MDGPTVVVAGGGGEEKPSDASHELGAHDEKLKQHDSLIDELKTRLDGIESKADAALNRTADVPEEVWTRLHDLENKTEQALETATATALEPVNEALPAEPLPVTPHQPTNEPKPKAKNSNPILRLLRKLR